MNDYLSRIVDGLIEIELAVFGRLPIVCPKVSGKTTGVGRFAASFLSMQDPDLGLRHCEVARMSSNRRLIDENSLLIDELQFVPATWSAVRLDMDRSSGRRLYN